MVDAEDPPHRRAAADFVRRVREAYGDDVVSVLLYGSVARGEHRRVPVSSRSCLGTLTVRGSVSWSAGGYHFKIT